MVSRSESGQSIELMGRKSKRELLREIRTAVDPMEIIRINELNLPESILVIADGNGSWAQERGYPPTVGHLAGTEALKKMLRNLSKFPEIRTIIIWAFAPNNYKRSQEEVDGIMDIITRNLRELIVEVEQRDGRVIHVGEKEGLPQKVVNSLINAEQTTAGNKGQTIALAINYGGEQQVEKGMQRAVEEGRQNPNLVVDRAYMRSVIDPVGIGKAKLVIRTGGEQRLSGIGDIADGELCFPRTKLPDFGPKHLAAALVEYAFREQRNGGRPAKAAY